MSETYPKRVGHITYKELPEENELMLVDEKNGKARVLNAEAGGVWLLCNGDHLPDDMATLLGDMLPEVDEGEIKAHVMTTIDFLRGEGLIE